MHALCAPQTRLAWFLDLHRSGKLDPHDGAGIGSGSASKEVWEDDKLTIVPLRDVLRPPVARPHENSPSAGAGADSGPQAGPPSSQSSPSGRERNSNGDSLHHIQDSKAPELPLERADEGALGASELRGSPTATGPARANAFDESRDGSGPGY